METGIAFIPAMQNPASMPAKKNSQTRPGQSIFFPIFHHFQLLFRLSRELAEKPPVSIFPLQ
jgi:hypothetical protein